MRRVTDLAALQAEGHETIAVQYGLDIPEGDAETTFRTLGRVSSPAAPGTQVALTMVARSTSGATCVPKSSIARMTSRWETAPILIWAR